MATYIVRTVHVGSAAVILGGALLLVVTFLLARQQHADPSGHITVMQSYEWCFWSAVGLIVATGVGNLGAFGAGLPEPDSDWGRKLTLKLGLVAVLLLLSAVRTMAVFAVATTARSHERNLASIHSLYAATVVLVGAILAFAVALAHG